MAVNVSVVSKPNESPERLLKRFLKKVKKERVIEEARERMQFLSNSEKEKRKRKRAKKTRNKEMRKKQKLEKKG